jgi:hypothetical protein
MGKNEGRGGTMVEGKKKGPRPGAFFFDEFTFYGNPCSRSDRPSPGDSLCTGCEKRL